MNLLAFVILMIFASRCESVVINCKYEVLGWVTGESYTCISTGVNSGNAAVIEKLLGAHLAGKSNFNVEAFSEEGRALKYIPSNLVKFFPNIKVLRLLENPLLRVVSNDLKPFPNLGAFILVGGQFTSISGDLFQHTKKFQYLQITGGILKNIGENLLSGMNELTFAHFAVPCIFYSANTPQTIEELKQKLLDQCPPLPSTTTSRTTTISTTTEIDCSNCCSLQTKFDAFKIEIFQKLDNAMNEIRSKLI